jgi:hypothetical protein
VRPHFGRKATGSPTRQRRDSGRAPGRPT